MVTRWRTTVLLTVGCLAALVVWILVFDPTPRQRSVEGASRDDVATTPNRPLAAHPRPAVEPSPSDRRVPKLRGRTVDAAGESVPNALIFGQVRETVGSVVVTAPVDLSARPLAKSAAHGEFELFEVPAGLLGLIAVGSGGVSEVVEVPSSLPSSDVMTIELHEAVRLSGVVEDSSRRPVPGARVTFTSTLAGGDRTVALQASTLGDGGFSFEYSIPSRPHRITATANGYEVWRQTLERSPKLEPLRVTLRRTQVVIDLTPPTGLGDFQPRAVVRRLRSTEVIWLAVASGASSSQARRIVGPPPEVAGGGVSVDVLAAGCRPRTLDLEWAPTQEPPHLDVALEAGGGEPSLTGRVSPVARGVAEVRAVPLSTSEVDDRFPVLASCELGAAGDFSFSLPLGRYRLGIRTQDFAPIAVDVSVPTNGLAIALRPAGSVEVTTLDFDGRRVGRVPVRVEVEGSRRVVASETDADGRVLFTGIPPGSAIVAPGRGSWFFGELRGHPMANRVVIEPGVLVRTEVFQLARARCELVVALADGTLLRNQRVGLSGGGYGELAGEMERVAALTPLTDSAGVADAVLLPGTYIASVAIGDTTQKCRFHWDPRAGARVQLTFPLRGDRIVGRVLDAHREPVEGVNVSVSAGLRSVESTRARSDAAGAFSLDPVLRGNVRLRLVRPSGRQVGGERVSLTAELETEFAGGELQLECIIPESESDVWSGEHRDLRVSVRVGESFRAGDRVEAQFWFHEIWVICGDGQTDSTGAVVLRVPPAERYRVRLASTNTSPGAEAIIQGTGSRSDPLDVRLVSDASLR